VYLRTARASDSDEAAQTLLKKVLRQQDGWAYNFQYDVDFGIDVVVDIMLPPDDNNYMEYSGKALSFQLKGGKSYRRKKLEDDDHFCACFKDDIAKNQRWIDTWMRSTFPIYILWIPDPEEEPDEGYWVSIREIIEQNPDFYADPRIYRFLKRNKFTKEQLDEIKKSLLTDEAGKKVREIPNEVLSVSAREKLDIYTKDEFKLTTVAEPLLLDEETDQDTIEWKYVHWGFRSNIPKNVLSSSLVFNSFNRDHSLVEVKWLINGLVESIQAENKISCKIDELLEKVAEWEDSRNCTLHKGLSTPLVKYTSATKKAMKFNGKDFSLFWKNKVGIDRSIPIFPISGLKAKVGEEVDINHFLILLANEAIFKRKNVRGPEIVLRTFDPAEIGYLSLKEFDPMNEFEIEFNHIVQYELVTNSMDNILFISIEDFGN
jgi:hypothetical protein